MQVTISHFTNVIPQGNNSVEVARLEGSGFTKRNFNRREGLLQTIDNQKN